MTETQLMTARHHADCCANGQPEPDFIDWCRDNLPALVERFARMQTLLARAETMETLVRDGLENMACHALDVLGDLKYYKLEETAKNSLKDIRQIERDIKKHSILKDLWRV